MHGTPVVSPLQLPTANLEYYLRESLSFVISALQSAPQIPSLEVLFERTQSCAARRKAILGTADQAAKDVVENWMKSDVSHKIPI